jgi:hypothetical protein
MKISLADRERDPVARAMLEVLARRSSARPAADPVARNLQQLLSEASAEAERQNAINEAARVKGEEERRAKAAAEVLKIAQARANLRNWAERHHRRPHTLGEWIRWVKDRPETDLLGLDEGARIIREVTGIDVWDVPEARSRRDTRWEPSSFTARAVDDPEEAKGGLCSTCGTVFPDLQGHSDQHRDMECDGGRNHPI